MKLVEFTNSREIDTTHARFVLNVDDVESIYQDNRSGSQIKLKTGCLYFVKEDYETVKKLCGMYIVPRAGTLAI